MKQLLSTSILIISIFFSSELSAQWIRGGVTLGFNATKVIGDHIFGYNKYGFHGGAVGTIPLKNNFLFSLETIYTQKGSNQSRPTLYYRQYRLELDYVEVPFYLQYNDEDKITAGLGFSYGRLVNVREWESGSRTNTSLLGDNAHYNRGDLMVLLDLKFRIYKRLSMNVRFQYSMFKIRTAVFQDDFQQSTWERKQYNNNLTFRVAYMFNEPLPPPKDDDQ